MYSQTLGGSIERRASQFIHVTKRQTQRHLNIISTNYLLGLYGNYSLPVLNGFMLKMVWNEILYSTTMQIIVASQLHTKKTYNTRSPQTRLHPAVLYQIQ